MIYKWLPEFTTIYHGSLALELFRHVNPILHYINNFEVLALSLKISPWTPPKYILCVTPLSLSGLDAWLRDAAGTPCTLGRINMQTVPAQAYTLT